MTTATAFSRQNELTQQDGRGKTTPKPCVTSVTIYIFLFSAKLHLPIDRSLLYRQEHGNVKWRSRQKKQVISLPRLSNTNVLPSSSSHCANSLIGNLSTRRSWFTNGMAGRAELDRGRGLRTKSISLSKTTWNHHERRQNNSVKNAFQRFALSFVSFLRREHDFRRRTSPFVWRILFEEPRIWTSGFNLRTRVLKSVPQLKNVLTCAVAVRLQKHFRLVSVVLRTSGA